jgi:2-(1,2-epoxy-1,2-dihydrophenyl)acetyl-CoA isomerase
MNDFEHLDVTVSDRVATLRLDRPDSLNALNGRLTGELIAALTALDADEGVRAIILTGSGRGFCAGADVADLAAAAGQGADVGPAGLRRLLRTGSARLARLLLEVETPMVAAVNGPCAGAGVGLAVACDFVLAAEDATFNLVFVDRGLVPDYGLTWLLPRMVGLRRARELALLGGRLGAREAVAAGLITRVVAGADLATEAAALARRLADGPGVALGLTKRLLADSSELDHATAVDREFSAQALCFASEDAREGAMAFLEKRPPTFRSR